jgi:hypothetical protein
MEVFCLAFSRLCGRVIAPEVHIRVGNCDEKEQTTVGAPAAKGPSPLPQPPLPVPHWSASFLVSGELGQAALGAAGDVNNKSGGSGADSTVVVTEALVFACNYPGLRK